MNETPAGTEVLMFGEEADASPHAEIIEFDENGKPKAQKVVAAAPAKPSPQALPQKPAQAGPQVKNPASSKQMGQALAVDAVSTLVDKMKAAAHAKGGMLSIQDIDGMQSVFASIIKEIQRQFESAFEDFGAARERAQWDKSRDEPFNRLLVKQFSSLFKDPPSRTNPGRRMLPGLFMATNMLLGPDMVEQYNERCRRVIARLREEHGDDNFTWDAFYAERDAIAIGLDVQTLIASQFADLEKRMNWFLTIVNSHLTPADPSMSEGEQRWEMTDAAFRRLLSTMCANLRKVLSSEKGRERLIKRHGQETVSNAMAALQRLAAG